MKARSIGEIEVILRKRKDQMQEEYLDSSKYLKGKYGTEYFDDLITEEERATFEKIKINLIDSDNLYNEFQNEWS